MHGPRTTPPAALRLLALLTLSLSWGCGSSTDSISSPVECQFPLQTIRGVPGQVVDFRPLLVPGSYEAPRPWFEIIQGGGAVGPSGRGWTLTIGSSPGTGGSVYLSYDGDTFTQCGQLAISNS